MPSVCLILKIHEPHQLRQYSFFDIGELATYVDEQATLTHLDQVECQCYLPSTQILLKQIEAHKGAFRFAIMISGVTLSLFERFHPELLAQFQRLADTGCVEFIGEPYFHSLSFHYSKPEFREQVQLHRDKLKSLFGKAPETFHYHALSYNNDLACEADALGFKVILSTGTDRVLDGRSPNRVYQPAPCPNLKLLFENPLLTENIARFSLESRLGTPPLSAPQFMSHLVQKPSEIMILPANLHDFHEPAEGEPQGALGFLKQFPDALRAFKGLTFNTPAQAAQDQIPCGSISIPGFASMEDAEHDARQWIGNELQKDAIQGLYFLEKEVKSHPDPAILLTWRQLQVSDHFLYMDTKQLSDVRGCAASNPYHSPYDAYINFMNILTDFSERLAIR